MLAADKDRLVAALKQNALELRQKELNYYVERYSNITTQASIVAGFAFDSLVELDISKDLREDLREHQREWVEIVYYAAAALTMAFALYTVCVSSFATVYGHRLALQGPTGSVERAVAVMMKQRTIVFVTFGISMCCLVVAAIAMAWIKMGYAAAGVTAVFAIFLLSLLRKYNQMQTLFRIPQEHMVQGDVRVNAGNASVDISRLEAGYGAMDTSTASSRSSSVATGYASSSSVPIPLSAGGKTSTSPSTSPPNSFLDSRTLDRGQGTAQNLQARLLEVDKRGR